MAKVIIPTPLRKFTDNQVNFESAGSTVKEVVRDLTAAFPGVKEHILDGNGGIRAFINIFVGDENMNTLQKDATPVGSDTVVSIVPAIAGGNRTRMTRIERIIVFPLNLLIRANQHNPLNPRSIRNIYQ